MSSPRSLYPNLFMGYVYYLDNEPIKAEKFVKKAMEMEPLAIRAHYYLGSIYLEQGRYDEAVKELRKEAALYPYFNNTYVAWGVTCYRQGRFAEAEGLWKRALEADPDNIEAIKNLAIYYYEVKNYPQAIYYVNEARKWGVEPPPEFLKALGL